MRPKKAIHERKKLYPISVYATEEEKTTIKQKAESLDISVSEFLLSRGLDYKISSFDLETKSLIHHLLKIGVNINQIARQLNAIAREGKEGELSKLNFKISEIEELSNTINLLLKVLKI